MWHNYLFYFIIFIKLINSENLSGVRIIDGDDVNNFSQFSYQVSVQFNGSHICGGTIISKKHVLTSVHCCIYPSGKKYPALSMTIGAGSIYLNLLTVYKVDQTYVHEYFDIHSLDNDIAVIRIIEEFNNWALIINEIHMPDVTQCTVSGWGIKTYDANQLSLNMQKADVIIVNWKQCYDNYLKLKPLSTNMICAGDYTKDACIGDSGGPLICRHSVVGIVSWGAGCGNKEYPGVYTKVANYKTWIQAQISGGAQKSSPIFFIFLFFLYLTIFT